MRRIIAGLRQSSQPGTINQLGDEMTFYGQGDPLDIAIAEEQRRTERARADQRLALSDASFVDPRLERDDPLAAAKIRASGAQLATRTQPIADGPLTSILEGTQAAARVLPVARGAERTEDIADANAEALNYSSPAQAGMRDARRWDQTLDAKNAANTFMNPVVTQGRQVARAEGLDPQTTGMEALLSWIKGQGQNPYPTFGPAELASLFGIKLPGVGAFQEQPGTAAGPAAPGAAPSGGMVMSAQEVIDDAQRQGIDPKRYADELRAAGVIIR